MRGHGFQRARQIRLLNDVILMRHFIPIQKNGGCRLRCAQRLQAKPGHTLIMRRHPEAFTGGANRRRQRGAQGQTSVFFCDMRERRRFTGNARCQRAIHRQAGDHIALFILIHFFMRLQRGGFPAIDHHRLILIRLLQQPETAAAQTGTVGLDHRQRRTDRHRRIKGIATRFKNFESSRRRHRMRAGNTRRMPGFGMTGGKYQQDKQACYNPHHSYRSLYVQTNNCLLRGMPAKRSNLLTTITAVFLGFIKTAVSALKNGFRRIVLARFSHAARGGNLNPLAAKVKSATLNDSP